MVELKITTVDVTTHKEYGHPLQFRVKKFDIPIQFSRNFPTSLPELIRVHVIILREVRLILNRDVRPAVTDPSPTSYNSPFVT